MALQSVPQDEPAKAAVISALRVAQMVWSMNHEWGKVDGSDQTESMPSLSGHEIDEIAKRTDRVFRLIIAGGKTALTALPVAKNIVQFPKQKKRGAKMRTGPCAAILTFPTRSAPDRLAGEDLLSEWAWIKSNHSGWDDEELSGRSERKKWQALYLGDAASAAIKGLPILDGNAIRKDIVKHRTIIEKRIRVKDWLETRGVNWDEVNSPEQALFFIYERMHASELPASA